MNRSLAALTLCCLLAMLVGCADSHDQATGEEHGETTEPTSATASATLEPKSDSGVTGSVGFASEDGQVVMRIEVSGATPGEHAFHLHETGDCGSDDGKSAGGHWNPASQEHGKLGESEQFHYGDTGNLTVADDGTGSATVSSDLWSIGSGEMGDVVGKAVIVHAGVDDLVSQPTGAAGGRIACGVITAG